MIFDLFQHTPLWGIFLFTFLLVLIAFQGGLFLGKHHRISSQKEDRSPIGSIVAATLGLLAFLLAFTFSIAASKFEERRELVVEEANAIGTTFLRSEYLSDPQQTKIKDLLKEYVITRIDAINSGKIEQGLKKSEELQDQLWQQAVTVATQHPDSVVVGLFIKSMNEVIDLHAKRVNIGIRIRIPSIVWGVLYLVTILAVGSLGYQFGLNLTRFFGITLFFIIIFSSVISLISDLDRPQEGFIKTNQQASADLLNMFNRNLHQNN